MDKAHVIQALNALAQERHLEIFRRLVEKGPPGIIMGAIGDALQLPHATLSFHLDNCIRPALLKASGRGAALFTAPIAMFCWGPSAI